MTLTGNRLVVLVNPSARQSGQRGWGPAVSALEASFEVDVATPGSPGGMAQAARDAARDGVAAVIVVGGDGSVNCVANALAGSTTPIAVLPLGTGNDFARAMGIPRDAAAAARLILGGRIRAVDLVRVGERLFCTAGALGVPADAAMSVRRWFAPGAPLRPLLHLLGGASYSLAGARHLLSLRPTAERYLLAAEDPADVPPPPVSLTAIDPGPSPDVPRPTPHVPRPTPHAPAGSFRAHGVFFANTPILGGGLVLPFESDASDGIMEIAVIPEMSRARLLWAFACLAQGWRVPRWALRTHRAQRSRITCEGPRPFAADGDLMAHGERFSVAVEPLALRVVC